jgi:hypothetical protein
MAQRRLVPFIWLLSLSLLSSTRAEDKPCTGRHSGKYYDLNSLQAGCVFLFHEFLLRLRVPWIFERGARFFVCIYFPWLQCLHDDFLCLPTNRKDYSLTTSDGHDMVISACRSVTHETWALKGVQDPGLVAGFVRRDRNDFSMGCVRLAGCIQPSCLCFLASF